MKKTIKKYALSSLNLALMLLSTKLYAANKVSFDIDAQPLSNPIEMNLQEVKKTVNDKKNEQDQEIHFILSNDPKEAKAKGFFSYEEYLEYRKEKDPELKDNNLFKGLLVNSEKIFADQNDIILFKDELPKKLDDLKNTMDINVTKNIAKARFFDSLSKMTGLSLFDKPQNSEDTIVVFYDFQKNENKSDFLVNLYNTAKNLNKNVIIYPLTLSSESGSEKLSYNWLKNFAVSKPSDVMNLNQQSFLKMFDFIRTDHELSKVFVDGIASNNIVSVAELGVAGDITMIKISKEFLNITDPEDLNSKKPIVISQEFLTIDKLKEFFDK